MTNDPTMYGLLYEMDPQVMRQIWDLVTDKVAEVKKYNNDPTTTFRTLRPEDISGTEFVYYTAMGTGTAARIFNSGSNITVPTGWGFYQLGWYCDTNLGYASYLKTVYDQVKRNEVPAQIVYRAKNPDHLFLTPLETIFAKQQTAVSWWFYQATGGAITGIVLPFAFSIAPASQLLMQTVNA